MQAGAGRTRIEVVGGRQLRASLKRCGADLDDLTDASTSGSERRRSSRGSTRPRRTGALAATVRGSGTKTRAVVRAGYARVPYAGPIHWGWPAHGITAQPWLVDAAVDSQPAWLPAYLAAVKAAVGKVEKERRRVSDVA